MPGIAGMNNHVVKKLKKTKKKPPSDPKYALIALGVLHLFY